MSRALSKDALNKVNIVGKLLEANFASGKTSAGREYERVQMTVRVTQTVGGQTETSEIPVSFFASKYKQDNVTLSPSYDNLQKLKSAKTAQNDGIGAADTVSIRTGSIRENNFVAKSGTLISGWQINTNWVNAGGNGDIASFDTEIFVMDMHDETDNEGDTTGRLIVKGGIVQYNEKLDILDFIVEDPDGVDFFSRTFEPNQTIHIKGRIRVTSQEVTTPMSSGGWGEELPDTTTRTVRELIITHAPGEAYDEDIAYDPIDIRKAFQARKAAIEQMQLDANKKAEKKEPAAAKTYEWQ